MDCKLFPKKPCADRYIPSCGCQEGEEEETCGVCGSCRYGKGNENAVTYANNTAQLG